jgi:hypothetical protein
LESKIVTDDRGHRGGHRLIDIARRKMRLQPLLQAAVRTNSKRIG